MLWFVDTHLFIDKYFQVLVSSWLSAFVSTSGVFQSVPKISSNQRQHTYYANAMHAGVAQALL